MDFGATDDVYSTRPPYPRRLYSRLLEGYGIGRPEQSILDLCTGTGQVARHMAEVRCSVVGIDVSPKLIEVARKLDTEAKVEVEYHCCRAEEFVGDRLFDVVTAAQCWHWLDRSVAAAKVRGLLKPGGKVAIFHFDWIPIGQNVVAVTEEVIDCFDPGEKPWRTLGRSTGVYAEWLRDLAEAGFDRLETFSFDEGVVFATVDAWLNRLRASAVAARLDRTNLEAFMQQLRTKVVAFDWPQADPHRLFCVVAVATDAPPHTRDAP